MRSKKIHWLDARALALLQGESLAEHGGLSGMRDEGALQSALARPKNRLAYQPESSLSRLAAAYAFGIQRNHPFNDGNKRAAFLATGLFLALNGFDLVADAADSIDVVFSVAAGKMSEESLASWIESHMVRLK